MAAINVNNAINVANLNNAQLANHVATSCMDNRTRASYFKGVYKELGIAVLAACGKNYRELKDDTPATVGRAARNTANSMARRNYIMKKAYQEAQRMGIKVNLRFDDNLFNDFERYVKENMNDSGYYNSKDNNNNHQQQQPRK